MAIQEDIKRRRAEDAPEPSSDAPEEPVMSSVEAQADVEPASSDEGEAEGEHEGEAQPVGVASPTQLGTRRFVYAAYFGGAIGIAFLASKVIELAWFRLQNWKPSLGEPHDEVVMPLAALIGAGAAVYYWRYTRARELAEEVATEMAKVTWPSRTEVTNGTVVVIVTTLVSTVFFALMDKFWGFVTNLVYGG
jgi:preprotein translocase subunit SecE